MDKETGLIHSAETTAGIFLPVTALNQGCCGRPAALLHLRTVVQQIFDAECFLRVDPRPGYLVHQGKEFVYIFRGSQAIDVVKPMPQLQTMSASTLLLYQRYLYVIVP